MWSLGMILHKLIFFRLPYPDIDPEDTDGIEREVLAYPGWKANPDTFAACKRRGLPRAILLLLESLLNRNPRERPTSERVLLMVREGTVRAPYHQLSEWTGTNLMRILYSWSQVVGCPRASQPSWLVDVQYQMKSLGQHLLQVHLLSKRSQNRLHQWYS